jgi:hypothetical protein
LTLFFAARIFLFSLTQLLFTFFLLTIGTLLRCLASFDRSFDTQGS